MGIIPRSRALALAFVATVAFAACAQRDGTASMQTIAAAAAPADYNPAQPVDYPRRPCAGPTAFDPLQPRIVKYKPMLVNPPQDWLSSPDTIAWYYAQLGRNAFLRGDALSARRAYRTAVPYLLRAHKKYDWQNQDALLRTGRDFYLLGDQAAAHVLWRTYIDRAMVPDYRPMARALRSGAYASAFEMMVHDTDSYTQRNPIDLESGGIQWIYAGTKAGAQGDYVDAQNDFRQAMNCGLWDPAYAVFGWASARYALGAKAEARNAWVEATSEGDASPGDMPFNNNANAAAATMLLYLPI